MAQGQCFELLVRQGSGSPLHHVARIAGSSLDGVEVEDWHRKLSLLATVGQQSESERVESFGSIDPLLLSEDGGLPLLWRASANPAQWQSFGDLRRSMRALRAVASTYRAAMNDLKARFAQTRSVECWVSLSKQRLELVRQTTADVLDWAVATSGVSRSKPAILLSGSASHRLGLISDVYFIPVWTAKEGRDLWPREILERLATGLNAVLPFHGRKVSPRHKIPSLASRQGSSRPYAKTSGA